MTTPSAPARRAGVDPRAVVDSLARAVVATDPDGRILLWNSAAEQLYGWHEDEVIGRSILEVLAPADDMAENEHDLLAIARGKSMSGDRLVRRRDGQNLRVQTFTRPVLDADGRVVAIVGSSEDVGDRRAAEQEVRDLSQHFRSALEAGGLGTFRWDMATGETIWDERLERLFGLAPGTFDGTFETYVSLLHPDEREELLRTVAEAVEQKKSYRVEHRVVWPDGSVHWIAGVGGVTLDEFGNVTGTVGCSMDITDRMVQQQEQQRLADAAIRAAENERLQRERLEFLGAINDILNSSSSVQEIMRNVTSRAVPRLGEWCTIHVLATDGTPMPDVEVAHIDPAMVAYARELQTRFPYDPDGPSGVAAAIRTGTTEFHPEISDELLSQLDLTDEVCELIMQLELGSSIVVAMKKRGRILGAIRFVASKSSRRYTLDDVALAETIAGRVASSIENLRLQAQQREIARTLQRSLLPASLPDLPGIDAAVRYWPNGLANEVGGDFYDLFTLDSPGQFALVLGDVCGTGAGAAALTGLARHTIRASAWHDDGPSDVLASLNRAVRRSGADTFLTCVYATLDRGDGDRGDGDGELTMTVACGGHPLPIHISANVATAVGKPGTLLGSFDSIAVHPVEVTLRPGDVVVFHTDGATDTAPPYDLDETQWRDLVAGAARSGGTADAIADRIRSCLESILPFRDRNDDIALVVLVVADRPASGR